MSQLIHSKKKIINISFEKKNRPEKIKKEINEELNRKLAERYHKRKDMDEEKIAKMRKIIHTVTIVSMIACIILGVIAYQKGYFTDKDKLKSFLIGAGIWGPLLFILLQIIQCIFPFLPGGISQLIGVMVFGPWLGFLYNYIGIVLGEITDFFLARIYGKPLVRALVDEKSYTKYIGWLEKKQDKFNNFYIITMALPGMPDDLICMIAGLSNMSFRFFFLHLLWTKIPAMLIYTLFLDKAYDFFKNIWKAIFH